MANAWDEIAADWDNMAPVRAYADRAFANLTQHMDVTGLRILDFGCGTGLLTERMAPQAGQITAIDLSPAMIDQLTAKAIPNVTAVQGDILTDALPALQTATFDLITAASVCAFVSDYPATLQRLSRLLAPGGWFLQWDWEDTGDGSGLTAGQITDALQTAGLTDIAVAPAFSMDMEETSLTVLTGRGRAPL